MTAEIKNTKNLNWGTDNFITNWKRRTTALIQIKAKSNARKNRPLPVGDDFKHYVGFLKGSGQDCILSIDRILKITHILYDVRQRRRRRDKIVFEAENKIDELEAELVMSYNSKNHPENKISLVLLSIVFLGLIMLGASEGFLSYKSFYYLVKSRFAATIISVAFAILWTIIAEKVSTLLKKAVKGQLLRFAIGIFGTIIFYIIAHLRALQSASSRAIIDDQPLPSFFDVDPKEVLILTAIGWLFFIGGIWLAQLTPSFQDLKQILAGRGNTKTFEKMNREILLLKKQIGNENETVTKIESQAILLLTTRKQAVKEVEGFLYLLLDEFKDINFSNRPDGEYPTCFNELIDFDLDTRIENIAEDLEFTAQTLTYKQPEI